ncbi:MAG: cupin domain-containing protein [Corynebacterium sp.]|nr:cupin domain-containing protein [Corynebacterium sp.]
MTEIPVNSPETFGNPEQVATTKAVLNLLDDAPAAQPDKATPAVKRILQGNRANLVVFTFLPGQALQDHEAAHPIFVQSLKGHLQFTVGDEVADLTPGVILHLDQHVRHRVDCPNGADADGNVLLVTMLTGV